MSARTYLPSAQFMVIVGALAVSGGIVVAAQYYASSHNAPASLASATDAASAQNQAWEQSLADIQAQSGATLPDAPPEGAVQSLLNQAQSSNLTDSIGRSVLVKLTAAGTQGLGDDIPTQNSIISEATAQINASQSTPKAVALSTVDPSDLTLRAYGNAVMEALANHPKASMGDTLLTIAKATDTQDSSQLSGLAAIGKQYKALADDLATLQVPKTLSPLHLQVVQDLYAVAATYPGMAEVVSDPLKGVTALQKYQLLMGEAGRVFTNIAESLKKSGILFSKDEPGGAWDTFLSAS